MGIDAGKYSKMAQVLAAKYVVKRSLPRRVESKDLAQSALLYLHREREKFDPSRGPEEKFAAAKIATGVRMAADAELAAKRGRLRTRSGVEAWEAPVVGPRTTEAMEADELWSRVKLAIMPLQYETLRMVFADGLSQTEAAARIGVSSSAVFGRIMEARKQAAANAALIAEVA